MLSVQEMKKRALDECVKMIGKEIVEKHKELCCASYRVLDEGLLYYCLGMDTKEYPYKMGDELPMEFYAVVIVEPEYGIIKIANYLPIVVKVKQKECEMVKG